MLQVTEGSIVKKIELMEEVPLNTLISSISLGGVDYYIKTEDGWKGFDGKTVGSSDLFSENSVIKLEKLPISEIKKGHSIQEIEDLIRSPNNLVMISNGGSVVVKKGTDYFTIEQEEKLSLGYLLSALPLKVLDIRSENA